MSVMKFSGFICTFAWASFGCGPSSSSAGAVEAGTDDTGSSMVDQDTAAVDEDPGMGSDAASVDGSSDDAGAGDQDTDSGTSDDDTDDTGTPAGCPVDGPIRGRVWRDNDASDLSTHVASFDEGIDEPLTGFSVDLLDVGGSATTVQTCDDGQFSFDGISDGTYIVATPDVPDGECAQRNCPHHVWDVVAQRGQLRIVTIGDSLPVHGDDPAFPARLAARLSPVVDTIDVNVADAGSRSIDWLPGSHNWHFDLAPELPTADVVVISVGGNDMLEMAQNAGFDNIPTLLVDAEILLAEIVDNVKLIASTIHEGYPDVDVVFCLYVDYSQSTTQPWDLVSLLPPNTIYNLLAEARATIVPEDEIIVADMLEPSTMLDGPLDELLAGALHLSHAGHDFYADELFRVLGGVEVVGGAPVQVRNVSLR